MARSVSACFAMTGKMRSLASALLVAMAIAVVGVEMSTCTGSDPCYACKNCKYGKALCQGRRNVRGLQEANLVRHPVFD
jgi:hypothetical protein